MKAKICIGLIGCAVLTACGNASDEGAVAVEASGPGAWVSLFDGSDLARWNQVGDANWQLVNDYVQADSGTGFLVSDRDYDDYELSLEFWVTPEANSGIFIRCQDDTDIGAGNCYEVNIYDSRPDPTYRTGSIVDVAPPSAEIHTGGRWNAYHIVADGPHLQVTLNGTQTVDVEHASYTTGPIALQYGAGTVIFRNVRLRPL